MHDIIMSSTGDFVPNWNGGLTEGDGDQIDYQDIQFRVLTNDPEFAIWPIGANLEGLIGQPNNPASGNTGSNNIKACLTVDGRFDKNTLNVTAVPISFNTIQFFVGATKVDTSFNTSPLFNTIVAVSL